MELLFSSSTKGPCITNGNLDCGGKYANKHLSMKRVLNYILMLNEDRGGPCVEKKEKWFKRLNKELSISAEL